MNDRPAIQLTDGSPVPADGSHTKLRPDGQQQGYVVLAPEERAKGFIRPYRDMYRHVGLRPVYPTRPLTTEERERYASNGYVCFEAYPESEAPKTGRFWTEAQLHSGCGQITTMGRSLSETYAREPNFYSGTFCATCGKHFPVGEQGEFVWIEPNGSDGPRVGT